MNNKKNPPFPFSTNKSSLESLEWNLEGTCLLRGDVRLLVQEVNNRGGLWNTKSKDHERCQTLIYIH